MYYFENKTYTQRDLITLLLKRCIDTKHPMAKTPSKTFDVMDFKGEWYNFVFKFNVDYELELFSCKKAMDIKGTSLRDCWKYILEGMSPSGKVTKGFSTNTAVSDYLKKNPDVLYRLERKEPNGSITVNGVLYDSVLKTFVIDRVPWKGSRTNKKTQQ